LAALANEAFRGALTLVLSVAVHAGTFAGLGALPVDEVRPTDPVVELSVIEQPREPEPEPEAPVPEPEKAPEPEPEPVKPPPKPVERTPKPPKEPPPPEQPPAPPAPAEETLADFSGTTLTGQGGWATAVGSGAPMNGPIGKPGAAVTGRNVAGVAGGVVGGTGMRIVAESDLSRKPKPPSSDVLNAALERSYPKSARQQGIEGVARIKVRVLPSGKLQPMATLSETYPGFADACRSSLRDVNFQPGLDRVGQPVATEIPYTCRFTVE
jgi:outer membrane biosynthesis protein TonB